MNDAAAAMGGIADALSFDQAAAAALLGIFVAGIVSWVHAVVTLYGIRRSAAAADAERRAALDLRDVVVHHEEGRRVLLAMVSNLGKGVARDVSVTRRGKAGQGADGAWFAAIGAGERVQVSWDLPFGVGEIEVDMSYDDGVRPFGPDRSIIRFGPDGMVVRERAQ